MRFGDRARALGARRGGAANTASSPDPSLVSQVDVLVVPRCHHSSGIARNWLNEAGGGAKGCAAIIEGDRDRGWGVGGSANTRDVSTRKLMRRCA